jgi:hypothetical protein
MYPLLFGNMSSTAKKYNPDPESGSVPGINDPVGEFT